jgi:CRP/FNR family transcriptional regulator, cyclic AMP receptor protein
MAASSKTPAKINPETMRDFLASSTFLGSLPTSALDQLIKRGHVVHYKKGAVIYQRGDAGDSLLLMLSGRVKIFNTTTDAREVVLNFLVAGDMSGEIAALDGRERTATAQALEATDAFVLYRRDLLPLLSQYPDALLEIVQVLCDKLRATSEIVEDSQRTMRGRTARGLLRLARQHGRNSKDGIVIDLSVNQRDLGNYLSLSRENTSRQLASLAEAGIIATNGHAITICDSDRLTDIAESETD